MDSQDVIIHARFAPNGAVVEIGERPATLTPQDWFYVLLGKAGNAYQALSGGRGVFRLTRDVVDTLKAESAATAA